MTKKQAKTKVCPQCGTQVPSKASYCGQCGFQLKTTPTAVTQGSFRPWIEFQINTLAEKASNTLPADWDESIEKFKLLIQQAQKKTPKAEEPVKKTTLPDESFLVILTISVPPSTKWIPDIAQNLMMSLTDISPLNSPLVLRITSTGHQIQWSIEVPRQQAEIVRSALYALYPQAQVEILPKTTSHVGYYRFDFHAGNSCIAPMTSAEDFKKTDPLATVIASLSNLDPSEEVIYELSISNPSFDYVKHGERLITKSTIGWWNFLHPVGMVGAAVAKTAGTDRTDAYIPEITKKIRSKLAQPLKEVDLCLKVKTSSQERAVNLVNGMVPSLAPLYLEGFNFPCPASQETYPMVLSPQELAALWHLPTEHCQSPGIIWSGGAVSPIPVNLIDQEGVLLGSNYYQGRHQDVRLNYPDRVTHVNLIGKTRVGKSTLLHQMAHQDMQAYKGVAVIDPHGDLVDAILATSIPRGRETDVVLFDTRDKDFPIGLNLLAAPPGVTPDAVAGQTLSVIRKMFAEQWSATRMESLIDASLRALVTYPHATIQDIPRLLLDPDFRSQVLTTTTDPTTLEFWYEEFEVESPRQQREFARPITYRLRKFYRDPAIRFIVCQKASLDFANIINTNKIFLANLSGVSDVDAETLGALLISKIQLAAMSRAALTPEQRTPYYLYIDEVQNFITTSLPKLFSEAGKYGISLVVANQFLKQLEGETLEAILGNVGTTIIFRVGPQDTRLLTPLVKEFFTTEDLTNLDRFHTVVKMQLGGQTLPAFSMITQPPLKQPEDADNYIQSIREANRVTYAKPVIEVEQELTQRAQLTAPERPLISSPDTEETDDWRQELID